MITVVIIIVIINIVTVVGTIIFLNKKNIELKLFENKKYVFHYVI